jgi:hypothetical protein
MNQQVVEMLPFDTSLRRIGGQIKAEQVAEVDGGGI